MRPQTVLEAIETSEHSAHASKGKKIKDCKSTRLFFKPSKASKVIESKDKGADTEGFKRELRKIGNVMLRSW